VDETAGDPFAERVAIVTGGASGIGRAVSAALAARGAAVVVADIDAAGARAVAEGIGTGATGAALDVTDAAAVRRLVEGTAAAHGRLDYLFNNAGIGAGGPVEQLELAEWQRVLDVDLNSVIYGVAAAYPIMVRQESGHIVNTASLAGLIPTPLLTPYAAAKHAVVGLSISLRVEAAAYGVRVSAVCPGPVDTPLLDQPGAVNARKLLTNSLGEPHPAEAMAADILGGVAENRALIVSPQSARDAWERYRSSPEGLLDLMAEKALASRARRAGGG
jgi:NAD(P)-dependent dehydrogenase (short-subunit alcohol dehydrogenase family)